MNDNIRVMFIGPHVGRNLGFITTQGELLIDCFENKGVDYISASSRANRYMRLADIVLKMTRRLKDVDVVIIDLYVEGSMVVEDIASFLAASKKKPIIFVLHGGSIPDFMKRHPAWFNRVLSRAAGLVSPSAFMARAVKKAGYTTTIIPNVIHLNRYNYRRREEIKLNILWMRSFEDIYNPMMAIKALSVIRRKNSSAKLVMAGRDKGIKKEVEEEARRMGLEEAVEFPGFLGPDEKKRYMDYCDVYWNTNDIDNMPVSILEACASGMIVVATKVGGIPDMLTDGDTAILVKKGDYNALAEATLKLMTDKELTSRISVGGRDLAQHSGCDRVMAKWSKLIGSIVADKNKILFHPEGIQ